MKVQKMKIMNLKKDLCSKNMNYTTYNLYLRVWIYSCLLENNLKISCLLYENVDYSDKKNWIKYSDRIDRTNNYKNTHLENAYL